MKFFSTLILSILLDQVTKLLANQFTTVQLNSGVSLSWLFGSNQIVLTTILFIFLLVIGWLWRSVWKMYPIWTAIFFGGALSNLLDRMLYSGVRDWITLPGLHLKNNIADCFVCIGLGLILWNIVKDKNGTYAD